MGELDVFHMTNLELVLNMLGETATTEISQKEKPDNFVQNKQNARKQLEKGVGKKAISREKFERKLLK